MTRNSKEDKRKRSDSPKGFFSQHLNFSGSTQGSTLRTVMGILLLALSVYLFFAYLSYFFSGAKNQGLVLNHSLGETISTGKEVAGYTGASGAYWMHTLVNDFVGIPLIFLIYYLFIVSGNLLHLFQRGYILRFIFSTAATFWSSLFLTLVCKPFDDALFFLPGGHVGVLMYESLSQLFGIIGVITFLLGVFFLLVFLFFPKVKVYYHSWIRHPASSSTASTSPQTLERETLSPPEIASEAISVKSTEESAEKESGWRLLTSGRKKKSKSPTEKKAPSTDDAKELLGEANILQTTTDMEGLEDSPQTNIHMEVVDSCSIDDQANSESLAQRLVRLHGLYDPKADLGRYAMPPLDLLEDRPIVRTIDEDEIQRNKDQIISTLQSFKLEISQITATVGPTITLYEVVPQTGVKISQIRNLEDDIALSLAALGIRIIAPIPGKGTVGIEVPNKKPQMVSMRSVLSSRKFQEAQMDLPIALGRTITNEVFTFDLAKTPHLLVAGATGQGKSVGLNAIITSLLYKKHPSELKFVMIDPKMVEFSIYSCIENHYLAKIPSEKDCIITDTNKVISTLNSLCQEMDNRYDLLMKAKVRNVKEYNEKFRNRTLNPDHGHRYMPYIVVVIDEYGDLIMTAGKDIELPIARLAQKARAVGMHAIIATQRPTASIITGTIKANFPGRMSFRVFSMIDSRTILDAPGANRLIGKGDLLFSQGNEFIRVQCAFIDTPEVTKVTDYIAQQPSYRNAYELPEVNQDYGVGESSFSTEERDPLFAQAARMLVMESQASTSLLQRKYSIGYNRAGRLMDQLEAAGIVSKQDGSKGREVLMTEMQLEQYLSSF